MSASALRAAVAEVHRATWGTDPDLTPIPVEESLACLRWLATAPLDEVQRRFRLSGRAAAARTRWEACRALGDGAGLGAVA